MVYKAVSLIGVVHACQLKDGMPVAEGIHIDEEALPVLKHNVFQMIIPVHQVLVCRNGIDE